MPNFGNIQDLMLQVIGLIIVVVGGAVIISNRGGKVRESANTFGVVVIGAAIIAIGTTMLFPQIGRGIVSTIFG